MKPHVLSSACLLLLACLLVCGQEVTPKKPTAAPGNPRKPVPSGAKEPKQGPEKDGVKVDPEKFSDPDKFWRDFNREKHADLLKVKHFADVFVSLEGTAKSIGIDAKDIGEFGRLRFKNNFAGFDIKPLPRDDKGMPKFGEFKQEEYALLIVRVWTVGDDYPVAVYLEAKVSKMFTESCPPITRSSLGYASAKTLKSGRQIKDGLSELIEGVASDFLKLHDKF